MVNTDLPQNRSARQYNGWSNYETWCVNLWLGNDQGSDEYWREVAQECWNESETETCFSRAERAILTLSDRLKDDIEEQNPVQDASLYSDLLSAAISEVNWYEIGEHFIDDVDQTFEESDEYETALENPDKFLTDAQQALAPFYENSPVWSLAFDTLAHARCQLEQSEGGN